MLPSSFSHLNIRTASNEDTASIKKLVFGVLEEFDLLPDPDTTDADLNDIEGKYHPSPRSDQSYKLDLND